MVLVFPKRFKVGLNGSAAYQKKNPNSIAWNPAHESLREFDHAADAPVKVGHVNGALGCQHAKFLRRKPAMARDIGKHFFRRLAGETSDSGGNGRPEGQNVFVDGHEVNDVAGFTPVGGCGRLVRGKVGGMQHISEKFIALRREKSESGIVDPFKPHPVVKALKLRFPLASGNLLP
jgi:hypothetical protein